MLKDAMKLSSGKFTIYIVLGSIFIITEIIDLTLDYLMGNSIIHSILQLVLFLFLFIAISKIFLVYSNRKMQKLIPLELMQLLKIINDSRKQGIIINQRKMRESLGITKPTLKKRVDALLELKYLFFEENGNHKYFRLTKAGESFLS